MSNCDTTVFRYVGLETQGSSHGYRFTKADRLLKRAEFVHLAMHARKIANRQFIAFFETGKHQHCRIGITASRKVGDAATRNRIKRLVREYFRVNKKMFSHPWDIHVVAKKQAAGGSSKAIFLAVENIFKRIESEANE